MKCYSSIICVLVFLTIFASTVLSVETEECGIINSVQFGNNQKVTQINEFPWMARIAHNMTKILKTVFPCQAVLISQQHLISVAHCFRDESDKEPYAVLLGEWDTLNSISEKDCNNAIGKCSTPLLIAIDEIILHPYFNGVEMKNDIALLRITQAVTYTDYIRPICLPSKDMKDREFGSEKLVLTGWFRRVDGHKRKLHVVVLNQHDCRRKMSSQINITDAVICGNTCDGVHTFSPGSALMDVKEHPTPSARNVYLIGILSYGTTVCRNRFPDILTRIDQYLDWIKENIY